MKQYFSKPRFVWNVIFYVITIGALSYFAADALLSGGFMYYNATFYGLMDLFLIARLVATVFEYIRQEKLKAKYIIDMVTSALLIVMMIVSFFYGAKFATGISKEFLAVLGVLAVILASYLVTYSIKAWKTYKELDKAQKSAGKK